MPIFGQRKHGLKQKQDAWLKDQSKNRWMTNIDLWLNEHRGKTVKNYVEAWIEECAKEPTIIHLHQHDGLYEVAVENLEKADRFGIAIDRNSCPINTSGKLIDFFRSSGNGNIVLENCTIREMSLTGTSRNLILKNCSVGILRLTEGSLDTFEMIGGRIDRIYAPAPSSKSPFIGSAEIRGVKLSKAFANAQAYRNLRHHLTSLHNHEAASVFHAAEMEAEVGKQSLVDRIISFFYRWLSNYGGSSVRPLIICGVLLLINFILLFLTDGVTLIGEVGEVDGWHYYLYGFDDTAHFLRAAVFSISQMFNPLGIFGTRLLLSAKTPIIALISALLGLASTIAFALFVLAVRRRFRLDRSS